MRFRIVMERDNINSAGKSQYTNPIAKALIDLGVYGVSVDETYAHMYSAEKDVGDESKRLLARLPPVAVAFMIAYNAGKNVEPIAFEVEAD
jgi:hypothetical protein